MICAVRTCGREIVRGPHGQWAHTTNPGRDHHYPRPPAARPSVDDLAVLGSTPSRDARRTTEPPNWREAGGSVSDPSTDISQSVDGVRTPEAIPA